MSGVIAESDVALGSVWSVAAMQSAPKADVPTRAQSQAVLSPETHGDLEYSGLASVPARDKIEALATVGPRS